MDMYLADRLYLFVIVFHIASCYNIECPSIASWQFRSTSFCNANKSYSCLFDKFANSYQENCIGAPVKERKGYKLIIRGGFDQLKCNSDRYMPVTFSTEVNSECMFTKSRCSSEGQVQVDNGTTISDRSCRCDYTKGYAFVDEPADKCKCFPTIEDCSCYLKSCSDSYILSPDYQCIPTKDWRGSVKCPQINTKTESIDGSKRKKILIYKESVYQYGKLRYIICSISVVVAILMIGISSTVLYSKCTHRCTSGDNKYIMDEDVQSTIDMVKHHIEVTPLLNVIREKLKEDRILLSLKDEMRVDINLWKSEDSKFVTSRLYDRIINCMSKNNCITVVGKLGIGKRSMIRHAALEYERNGYSIIPIKNPADIIRFKGYPVSDCPKLFVIENVCGTDVVDIHHVQTWQKNEELIDSITENEDVKIISSCQDTIFHNSLVSKIQLFRLCVCEFNIKTLWYCDEELRAIAEIYLGKETADLIADNDKEILRSDFPLLCKIYRSMSNTETVDINNVLRYPSSTVAFILDSIAAKKPKLNVALALCVMFDNHVDESFFIGELNQEIEIIFKKTCEALSFGSYFSGQQLKSYFDDCLHMFLIKDHGVYKSVHETLFHFLALYFGQKIMYCIIRYGVSSLVNHVCLLERNSKEIGHRFDTCTIVVPRKYSEQYIGRMLEDWKSGDVITVFTNRNLESVSFRETLIYFLNRIEDKELVRILIDRTDGTTNDSPLTLSCNFGYSNIAKWLIERGSNVNHCRHDTYTPLLLACEKGDLEIVEQLIKHRANVFTSNSTGESPLILSCKHGHYDIVNFLLEIGHNPNQYNKRNDITPLIIASRQGHIHIVESLISYQTGVNVSSSEGVSALFVACEEGLCDTANVLIKSGANVDKQTRTGASPLYIACQNGHSDVVKVLIQADSSLNAVTLNGVSPLFISCQEGHIDIARCLLENGADVNMCRNDSTSALFISSKMGNLELVCLLIEYNADKNICNNLKMSPLYTACKSGRIDIVHKFLYPNFNINNQTSTGETPLFAACYAGHEQIVKVLLCAGVKINLANNNDERPLFMSCLKGFKNIVELLLDKKANVNCVTKMKQTPLYIASSRGYIDIVKLLVEANANINQTCIDGESALHQACLNDYSLIVQYLLEKGANANLTKQNNESPLFVCCLNKCKSSAAILLRFKANVKSPISNGKTPLHVVCEKGYIEMVKLLLSINEVSRNGILNLQDDFGTTPIFTACEQGFYDIVILLLSTNADINIPNHMGVLPLHVARVKGYTNIMIELLR